MVSFALDGIDDSVIYGIVSGRMKEFRCATKPLIRWGETICS